MRNRSIARTVLLAAISLCLLTAAAVAATPAVSNLPGDNAHPRTYRITIKSSLGCMNCSDERDIVEYQ